MSGQRRQIFLDTETTGLSIDEGHRLIEVAAVEYIDGKPSGRAFHSYINPQRPVSKEAQAVHGISDEFLKDKPVFLSIAESLREFIENSEVVITCRSDENGRTVDQDMMAMEFTRAALPAIPDAQWTNVRKWSEAMFGYEQAKLNAIADRYGIDREGRSDSSGHGALKDALLLAAVYPSLKVDYERFRNAQGPSGPKGPCLLPN